MTKYMIGTPEQVAQYRKAFNRLMDLPMRGIAVGGPDIAPKEYKHGNSPGWTTQAFGEPDVYSLAIIQVPEDMEKHLGQTTQYDSEVITLPTRDDLVSEEDLPKPIRDALARRRDPLG